MRRASERTRSVWTFVGRVALLAAGAAMVLGLGNRPAPKAQPTPQLDVLVAVDRTTSMSALDDPTGSRMTAARRDLIELGDHLDAAQFSVVTFGTSATLQLPFTSDRVAFDDEVSALQVEKPAAGAGSSIGLAARMLASVLDRAKAVRPDHVPVVVFLSDGESTAEGAQDSFAPVGQRIRTGVVLGYGTEKGGVMPLERVPVDQPVPSREDTDAVITDPVTGAPVRSRLDNDNLDKVAYQLGATYVPGDGTPHDMAAVATQLEAVALATLEPGEPERELRWFWGLVLLLLLLPELRRGWRMYWQARRAGRA